MEKQDFEILEQKKAYVEISVEPTRDMSFSPLSKLIVGSLPFERQLKDRAVI